MELYYAFTGLQFTYTQLPHIVSTHLHRTPFAGSKVQSAHTKCVAPELHEQHATPPLLFKIQLGKKTHSDCNKIFFF